MDVWLPSDLFTDDRNGGTVYTNKWGFLSSNVADDVVVFVVYDEALLSISEKSDHQSKMHKHRQESLMSVMTDYDRQLCRGDLSRIIRVLLFYIQDKILFD